MMRIHVLTAGFTSPNGAAFLMPLIVHKRALRDAGFSVQLFGSPSPGLTECDALLLDGQYYAPRWSQQTPYVLEEIAGFREQVDNLVYVDLLDSAGWDHARALPYVKLYCKSQLLRDRSAYLKPLYGYRAFSDFYHRHMAVNDASPVMSEPVTEPALLEKLVVSWNSGLADYSWLGAYLLAVYRYIPLPGLLRMSSKSFYPARARRTNDVSCRMGTSYIRASVSFQRQQLVQLLKDRMATTRLSRRQYVAELRNSKIVLSPFGYGEVCYRDFETFMSGALLLKPDMSEIETWPDFYREETMMSHRWDLSDVREKIELILSDYPRYIEKAEQGQLNYQRHLCGRDAAELFVERLQEVVAKLDQPTVSRRPDRSLQEQTAVH
jgi:hypothetical protein